MAKSFTQTLSQLQLLTLLFAGLLLVCADSVAIFQFDCEMEWNISPIEKKKKQP